MGEISENIQATFTNIIQVYEQTANLFLDVDDLMIRNGYRVLKGSALEGESSRSLNYPRWWAMFYGVRYYIPEADPFVAKAVGVFFLDSRMDPIEPILVVAAMNTTEHESESEIEPFGVIREAWFKKLSDHTLEKNHEFDSVRKVSGGVIRGMLLEKVADREALEQLIVSPLLEMG